MAFKFQDSENIPRVVKDGDYIVEVIQADFGISKKGNDMVKLRLRILPENVMVFDTLVFTDDAAWKVDTFLKSCGVKLNKGDNVEFDPKNFNDSRLQDDLEGDIAPTHGETYDLSNGGNAVFVAIIGLRGWATLKGEEYPIGSGKKTMRVVCWLTDRKKVERESKMSDPKPKNDEVEPF